MIVLIQILSLLGFLISLYFVLVYHHRLPSNTRWIPAFCRMEDGVCEQIIRMPDARLLGVPNFHVGIVFYAVLVLSPFVLKPFTGVADGFMIALGIAVGMGIYLTSSLLFDLKKKCVLCFAAHGINLLLFLLFRCRSLGRSRLDDALRLGLALFAGPLLLGQNGVAGYERGNEH